MATTMDGAGRAGAVEPDASAPSVAEMQGFMFQSGSTAMRNELKFEAAKSLRTALVVLASLNAVAAAATAVGIVWDCYIGARRSNPAFTRPSLFRVVGPVEMFPFILSCGIVIQSIMFAAAQSNGLEGLLILGCTPLSQLMLPALFLVPYIQLVFGLETTARALRRRPFPERPRWAVPVCLGVVAAGFIGTYIVTRFIIPPNFCFAELMWLVQRWSQGCFGLLLAIVLALVLGSLIFFFQLYRTWGAADVQRAAALWTACYMVLAVAIMVVMISFFATSLGQEAGIVRAKQMELSTAAAVAANLSGFLTGALYILLRCTRLGRRGSQGYFEFDRQKPRMGNRTMSNLMYTKQMERPVLLEWMKKKVDRLDEAKMEEEHMSSSLSSSTTTTTTTTTKGPEEQGPQAPEPPGVPDVARVPPTPTRKPSLRKDSYNLFPPRQEAPDAKTTAFVFPPAAADTATVPTTTTTITGGAAAASKPSTTTKKVATTLSPDVLLPPTAVWAARRERNSSLGSSATVQIGLRVSNINDMPPGTSYYEQPSRPESDGAEPDRPETYGLAISTDEPSPVGSSKQLPPAPLAVKDARARDEPGDDETKLSPTVYSPQKPSPTKGKSRGPRSPPRAPPPGPSRSASDRSSMQSEAWI